MYIISLIQQPSRKVGPSGLTSDPLNQKPKGMSREKFEKHTTREDGKCI
jgi:hypothetical protein